MNTWNLGTGQGHSVLEVVKAFEVASGKTVPYRIEPRRLGDVATCWADASLAKRELGWRAKRNLEDMMADTWRWQKQNPQGMKTPGREWWGGNSGLRSPVSSPLRWRSQEACHAGRVSAGCLIRRAAAWHFLLLSS